MRQKFSENRQKCVSKFSFFARQFTHVKLGFYKNRVGYFTPRNPLQADFLRKKVARFFEKMNFGNDLQKREIFRFGPSKIFDKIFRKKRFLVQLFGPTFSGLFQKCKKWKKVKNHEKLFRKSVLFLLSYFARSPLWKQKIRSFFRSTFFAPFFKFFHKSALRKNRPFLDRFPVIFDLASVRKKFSKIFEKVRKKLQKFSKISKKCEKSQFCAHGICPGGPRGRPPI